MLLTDVTVVIPAEELRQKKKDLTQLEQELAEMELLLSTCKGELHLFEKHYNQVVGPKYAEYDEIRAQLLELVFKFDPHQEDLKTAAESAREEANQSARETRETQDNPPQQKKYQPSEDLKKMFREVAKKIHPDLTTDRQERVRRHQLMAQLNQAYDELDQDKIQSILQEWEGEFHARENLTVGAQLLKAVRQIAQVKSRLQRIQAELEQLENSEMCKLKERVDQMKKNGRDVVHEMVASVQDKINSVKSRVRHLSDELTYL